MDAAGFVQRNPHRTPAPTVAITQTLEVLVDNGYNASAANTSPRIFRVNINSVAPYATDSSTTPQNPTPTTAYPTGYNTQLPGMYIAQTATNSTNLGTIAPFVLDGRWLHAFNGPGMTTNAVHANFRYNGSFQGLATVDGNPNLVGMDEDYDAVDLENWFLAMQGADGSVMIPSFHRPAAIRVEYNPTTNAVVVDDWRRRADTTVLPACTWQDSASRILRPCSAGAGTTRRRSPT